MTAFFAQYGDFYIGVGIALLAVLLFEAHL